MMKEKEAVIDIGRYKPQEGHVNATLLSRLLWSHLPIDEREQETRRGRWGAIDESPVTIFAKKIDIAGEPLWVLCKHRCNNGMYINAGFAFEVFPDAASEHRYGAELFIVKIHNSWCLGGFVDKFGKRLTIAHKHQWEVTEFNRHWEAARIVENRVWNFVNSVLPFFTEA